MQRRDFVWRTGAALGVGAMMGRSALFAATPEEKAKGSKIPVSTDRLPPLAPPRAKADRIIRVSACLRPFREQGPRVEHERIGEKSVVHNYGHGGSGWSLSWGSGMRAAQIALDTGAREIGVIGCGALGITAAILLQRAGAKVTIYAKDRPPEGRSTFATGVWSPDSRICSEANATSSFAAQWEIMCRESYRKYQTYLGVSGDPIEWMDRYAVSTIPFEELRKKREVEEGPMKFGKFQDRVRDLTPGPEDIAPGAHPFGVPYVRRSTSMVFNIASYQRVLVQEFVAEGGRILPSVFHSAGDFASLPEATLVNCTGYGARQLLGDETLVPVRGQLALLIPQPEVRYGLSGEDVSMVPRRDGIVVQTSKPTDYGSNDETPNRAQSEEAVEALARLVAPMYRAAGV